jgi:hypothetical protein
MKPEWKDAPKWAKVLLDGHAEEPSKYSWATAYRVGAKRQYCRGGRLVARVELTAAYTLVERRPDNG